MVDYDEIQVRAYRGTLAVLQDIAYHEDTHAREAAEEAWRVLQNEQLRGEVAGLTEAIQQLATGRDVDFGEVRQAAAEGAQRALEEAGVKEES